MAKASPALNAGVHASVGFEFQKHCAIHMLLSRYSSFNGKKYFLCLEHHDDLTFCFLGSTNAISNIEAYQAKKSGSGWTMGKVLTTILKKLTQTGLDIAADTHPKVAGYFHTLEFVTNDNINLHCGSSAAKRKYLTVNEANEREGYLAIDPAIQANIIKGLKKEAVTDVKQLAELDRLAFAFIDLPKKAQDQKNTLVGLIDKNSQGLAPGPTICKESEIFEIWEKISQSHIM